PDKDRVAAKLKRKVGDKIGGEDLLAATCVYTEPHLARFLVENSVRATGSVKPKKLVRDLTVLDPACGSGHILLEAFDCLYAMYEAEGQEDRPPQEICRSILSRNLLGLDIDPRAVRLARTLLVLRCREIVRGFVPSKLEVHLLAGHG